MIDSGIRYCTAHQGLIEQDVTVCDFFKFDEDKGECVSYPLMYDPNQQREEQMPNAFKVEEEINGVLEHPEGEPYALAKLALADESIVTLRALIDAGREAGVINLDPTTWGETVAVLKQMPVSLEDRIMRELRVATNSDTPIHLNLTPGEFGVNCDYYKTGVVIEVIAPFTPDPDLLAGALPRNLDEAEGA